MLHFRYHILPPFAAVDVKFVQILPIPVKEDLQHGMQLGKRRVAVNKESAPNEGTDPTQDDTQLINVGQFRLRIP
jgi:hypothetical protein